MTREALPVVAAALGARLAYFAAGMRFDDFPARWYWQFLDLRELAERLASSLVHLHSQPPAMNLLLGVALKLFGTGAPAALALLYAAVGVARDTAAFLVVGRATGSRAAAWTAALVLALNPVGMVYEHHLSTTHLAGAALVLALCALERLAGTGRAKWLALFGLALLAVTLLRSMYQPAWAAALIALSLPLARPPRRALPLAALLAIALAAWPLKNLVVFGRFTSSSWLGMNLYRTVYNESFSEEEMRAFAAGRPQPDVRPRGARSPIAHIPPFSRPERYLEFLPSPPTGVPVLDDPQRAGGARNLNHRVYLEASRIALGDYLGVLREDPAVAGRVFLDSLAQFLRPGSDLEVLRADLATRAALERFRAAIGAVDLLLYWRPPGADSRASAWSRVSPSIALAFPSVMVAGIALLLRRRVSDRRSAAFWGFLGVNSAYVLAVGTIAEYQENMRFRFEIEALTLLGVVAGIHAALAARRRRRGAASPSNG